MKVKAAIRSPNNRYEQIMTSTAHNQELNLACGTAIASTSHLLEIAL
jgi:hypothetical protein